MRTFSTMRGVLGPQSQTSRDLLDLELPEKIHHPQKVLLLQSLHKGALWAK